MKNFGVYLEQPAAFATGCSSLPRPPFNAPVRLLNFVYVENVYICWFIRLYPSNGFNAFAKPH